MRLADRILRGAPGKPSRFRDHDGRLPPPSAWAYLPRCLASTLLFKLSGRRPEAPWLGYRGIRRLRQLAGPGVRVLEFGAGMSTLWFARRGCHVLSLETDAAWLQRVSDGLAGVPGHHVRLELAVPPYGPATARGETFDLALVDGAARVQAAEVALRAVRPGGHVYLDNADVPEYREGRERLLAEGSPEWFVDFTPTHVYVSAGLLVKKATGRSAARR